VNAHLAGPRFGHAAAAGSGEFGIDQTAFPFVAGVMATIALVRA
jgi:hypothetical protein